MGITILMAMLIIAPWVIILVLSNEVVRLTHELQNLKNKK